MQTYQQLLADGDSLFDQGAHIPAIKVWAEAYRQHPEQKEALTKLGLAYQELGDLDGAIGFLEMASLIDGEDAFLRFALGLACYEGRRLPEAVRHLESAIGLVNAFLARAPEMMATASPTQRAALAGTCAEFRETVADAEALVREIESSRA